MSKVSLTEFRAALGLAMIDRLDVVAVRIEQESGVIAGVIVGTFAGRAIVFAAGFEARGIEAVDRLAILGLESDVMAAGELSRGFRTVRRRDEKLIAPEMAGRIALDRDAQDLEHGLVEAPARVEVRHDQLDVIDQSSAMQFH